MTFIVIVVIAGMILTGIILALSNDDDICPSCGSDQTRPVETGGRLCLMCGEHFGWIKIEEDDEFRFNKTETGAKK